MTALRAIHRLPPAEFTPYGLTDSDISTLTVRIIQWAEAIEN